MNERPRFVIDTNVLVSWALMPNSPPSAAVDLALDKGTLLFSRATFEELAGVLMRPKFDPYVKVERRNQIIAQLGIVAADIEIVRRVQVCRDPKDDKILEVAVNGAAQAVITGDKDLLVLHPYIGISIVTPAEFLTHAGNY